MLSKVLNTKTLIILLVILAAILVLVNINKREDRTFRNQLVSIDTATITKIEIIPKIGAGEIITITKTADEWKLKSGNRSYMPDVSSLRNILGELTRLQTERVAATSKSDWDEFEVTDSLATRVKVYGVKKIMANMYLGKLSYSQPTEFQNPNQRPQTRMFTHVRLADEETVYVIEGFLKMTIQPNVDAYRMKMLCKATTTDITRVSVKTPEDQFLLSFEQGQYLLDGEEADSTKTVRYLQTLSRLTSTNFIDNAIPLTTLPTHTIRIEGNNMFPVEIKASPTAGEDAYIVTSSMVPDAKYSGSKGNLFERIFVGRDAFIESEAL